MKDNTEFRRERDPEVQKMANSLAEFERDVLAYTERLRAELQSENARQEPYEILTKGLKRQLALVEALGQIIDEDLWDHLIIVANMSASLSQKRTRQFY